MRIILNTTGTLSAVTLADLGDVTFLHPITGLTLFDSDLTNNMFNFDDIKLSKNIRDAITAGYITVEYDGRVYLDKHDNISTITGYITGSTYIENPGIYWVDSNLGPYTISLPEASSDNDGYSWEFRKHSFPSGKTANIITIEVTGQTQLIANSNTLLLTKPSDSVKLVSNNFGTQGTPTYRYRPTWRDITSSDKIIVGKAGAFKTLNESVDYANAYATKSNPITIFLDPETFILTDTLHTYNPYVRGIIGTSERSTTIRINQDMVNSGVSAIVLHNNTTLEGFRLDSSGVTGIGSGNYGIHVSGVTDEVLLRNIHIDGFDIAVSIDSSMVYFSLLFIYNSNYAMVVDNGGTLATNNVFTENCTINDLWVKNTSTAYIASGEFTSNFQTSGTSVLVEDDSYVELYNSTNIWDVWNAIRLTDNAEIKLWTCILEEPYNKTFILEDNSVLTNIDGSSYISSDYVTYSTGSTHYSNVYDPIIGSNTIDTGVGVIHPAMTFTESGNKVYSLQLEEDDNIDFVFRVGTGQTQVFRIHEDGNAQATTFNEIVVEDEYKHMTNAHSNGVLVGGEVIANVGDNTKFDILSGVGWIVDNHTDPLNPIRNELYWDIMTGLTTPYLNTHIYTYVGFDINGDVIMQTEAWDESDRRDYIVIAKILHVNKINITSSIYQAHPLYTLESQVFDFTSIFGSMNIEGNIITASGGTLKINKTAGKTYRYGVDVVTEPKDPHVSADDSTVADVVGYAWMDTGVTGGWDRFYGVTGLTINRWDDGTGTLPLISSGWTIQPFWHFGGSNRVYFQYGQAIYDTLEDALDNRTTPVGIAPTWGDAAFMGWMFVNASATTLDTAEFVYAGTFDRIGSAGSAGGGGAAGEVNTASNVGTEGVGVYNQKVGVDLQFRNIASGSTKVSVDLNGTNINVDVVEEYISHLNISDTGITTHADLDTHVGSTSNPHQTTFDNLTNTAHTHLWGDINNTPTTISGYGITDSYTKTEVDNNFLSGNTTINDLDGYSTTQVDNNFLSATTSVNDIGGLTETEIINNFLSGNTTINDLDGYSTTQVDNNFLSGNTTINDLDGYSTTQVDNLLTGKTDLTLFNSHTGNTNNPHGTTLDNLTDTTILSIEEGQILKYTGGTWKNKNYIHSDLSGRDDYNQHNISAIQWYNDDNDIYPQYSNAGTILSSYLSSTSFFGFDVTDNLDGTIDLSLGTAIIRKADSDLEDLYTLLFTGATGISLVNNETNYVFLSYFGGVQQIVVVQDISGEFALSNIPLYTIDRINNHLHIIDLRKYAVNYAAKNSKKDFEKGYEYISGSIVSDGATIAGQIRFNVTPGEYYLMSNKLEHISFNSGDTFWYIYRDGNTGFTYVTGSTLIDYANYDNGIGTLASATTNYYTIHEIYVSFTDDQEGHYSVLYGRDQYDTLENAQTSSLISENIPNYIETSVLISRIITQNNSSVTSIADIQSPHTTTLTSTSPTTHNGLTGLQGGFAGQYYHLNNSEYTTLRGGSNDASSLHNHNSTYINVDGDTMIGQLTTNDLYLSGTTIVSGSTYFNNLSLNDTNSTILGTNVDGEVVSSEIKINSLSLEVIDISGNTTVTDVTGIYYVDTTTGDVTITIPDSSVSNDATTMRIIKKTGNNSVIVTTVGGTQNIGGTTTQTITQNDKGFSIVSDFGNTKYLIVQDSRFTAGSVEGEMLYWSVSDNKFTPTTSAITWDDITNTLNLNDTSKLNVDGLSTFNNNVTIVGDLYVSGTTVTINTKDLNISDNIILLNSGETGSGVTLGTAGIQIDRGSLTDYQMIYQESDDTFRSGEIGSTQAIAHREDVPSHLGLAYWNSGTTRFETDEDFYYDIVNKTVNVSGITVGDLVVDNITINGVDVGSSEFKGYSSIYMTDNLIPTVNPGVGIPLKISGITTQVHTNQFDSTTTHRLTYAPTTTGATNNFHITVTTTAFATANGQLYTFFVYKNGVALPDLIIQNQFDNKRVAVAINGIVEATDGDYFEVWCQNDTSATKNLTVTHFNFAVVQI
jgi:hypothetical protein